jgi:hypothetical protein
MLARLRSSGPRRHFGCPINLALLITSLSFALLLGEGSLRLLGWKPMYVSPERDRFWAYDSMLGWAHRPGQEGWFETEQFRTYVRINQRGLRDRDHTYERSDSRQRILVLGDSFAWGYGVDEAERFSQRLETALNVEVINAGVSGYSTDQELLWYREEGVKYDVDLVILVLTGNDIGDVYRPLVSNIYYKPRFLLEDGGLTLVGYPVPQPSGLGRFVYQLSQQSALAYLSIQRYFDLRTMLAAGRESTAHASGVPFALTIALLDEIQASAHSHGARLLIVATNHWWNSPSQSTYSDLVTALSGHGFPVLDVEATLGFDRESMLIPDDGHWNKAGHAFVAAQIGDTIMAQELLGFPLRSLRPLATSPRKGYGDVEFCCPATDTAVDQ